MVQALLPHLRPGATIVAITSDAAVEPYEGWGAYGAAKAGFEHLAAILGAERPDLRVLRVDPGDMRTQMHQDAFPGEDISDRPEPEASVPGLRALIAGPYPSGRYRASEVPAPAGGGMKATISLPERVLDIEVPPELIADHPVEAEGRRRDDVRMLVAERSTGRLTHARAADLDRFLRARRRARGQHLARRCPRPSPPTTAPWSCTCRRTSAATAGWSRCASPAAWEAARTPSTTGW